MAINVGYEILVDSGVTDNKKAELVWRILQSLDHKTLAVAYATTYSAGASSTNQATITVGGTSEDFGIRVIFDSAVIGTDEVLGLLSILAQVLDPETLTVAHASSYTAGSRVYNLVITLT